jgi:acetylornithine deacetylase/succinyl-diaminopimelate desuccinylase-like protein
MNERQPATAAATRASEDELGREATQLLQALIRFKTVNPPGDERRVQEFLAALLREAGFSCELLGASEERPNLIARLAPEDSNGAAAEGPTLCLLSHVDTVLADPAAWSHDPWSGDQADGYVWGRGALDMKDQTAAEVVAACALARSGWRPPRGELLIVSLVDEETGGSQGAVWICENHAEKVRCDYLINEGGGWRLVLDGDGGGAHAVYGLGCAEKGVFRFTITTEGVAAHASMPRLGENALLKMVPFLARMGERQPSLVLTDEPRALLAGIGEDPEADLQLSVERVRAREPALAVMLEAMLGVTLAPTRIFASDKINVIPSATRVAVDCRVPPGLGERDVLEGVREVLGSDGYRLEFTEQVPGNRSPFDGELVDHIRGWVSENDPGAACVPSVLPGFTDSRTFRATFPECRAYGFFPHRHMPLSLHGPLVHGADERIDVREMGFATRFFGDMIQRMLG